MIPSVSKMPDHYFVTDVHLDGDEPYCEAVPEEDVTAKPQKFTVPKALAYFLTKHWPGTEHVKELHERAVRVKMLEALGVKQDQIWRLLG
jgi:hypothetical protein